MGVSVGMGAGRGIEQMKCVHQCVCVCVVNVYENEQVNWTMGN